jgi:hypothetical protein
MDHPEAIMMKAAERYVLGDLSVSEVEEFERHFFDCPQCSEELRILSILQENARAVFIEQDPGPLPEPAIQPAIEPAVEPVFVRANVWDRLAAIWRQPWAVAPALAAVAVAVLIGYQTGMREQSRAPQPVAAFPLYAASRGDETVVAPPAGAQFYTLYMDRTWDRDDSSYTATLRDDPGNGIRYSLPLGPLPLGQAIQVLLPVRSLQAGRYALVISASDGTELARYPFTLRFH